MMKTIKIDNEKIYKGTLLLVNADYPYKAKDTEGQIPVDSRFPNIMLKKNAANILQFILEKIGAEASIVPVSGYRSEEEQTDIYNDSLMENGEEFTRKYVALPSHSEHETGQAIDLGLNKENIDFICPDFPYKGICDEFRKVAPQYGFIQRYTREKEKITGISHEPWHFRYVGYPHSKIITELGLSLEEYIEFIKNYTSSCKFSYMTSSGARIEVYYVPKGTDETLIEIPNGAVYQISGNNVDGFIVTLWRKSNG